MGLVQFNSLPDDCEVEDVEHVDSDSNCLNK